MLLSNRCLLARVQPRPARPSKARAAGVKKKKKKRRISMGPQEKTAFTLFPDKYVVILRDGWDKRTPKRTFVWRDECRQRNYSKFSGDCLRNKGKLFFTFQRIHIRSVAASEGRNTAEKSLTRETLLMFT